MNDGEKSKYVAGNGSCFLDNQVDHRPGRKQCHETCRIEFQCEIKT